ncbi:hypothetical protein A2154_02190 [Candidatus Gottesmanbacteria bacterium RBG_16_43_7]|uniref:Uncharacterized protein n=1 Tax=Candidatus Gottesmanbacteria bacterium RBG_16_43_7 TaxID=1798373 RepID=A0A1F5Z8R7_9BACT|nr:MAG: hypothetical protein A2154_02190 [Candidatus Gottesmanbacteria bacterium RBG_16_43_7]
MSQKTTKQNASFSDSELYYDDCPICRAMKEAEKRDKNLTLPELKQAFVKAKDQGAVVGGSLIEDKTN